MDATPQPLGLRAEFTGDARRFFRLALIGNLLQIPTFGFYRFWLITDIRRHLWSHTRVGGEFFEYTGRGRELLIGFLIAMAILTPLYAGYFLLGLEAELWQAFASLPLTLLIYVLMHYGAYRARRYRATRTAFRGVRFWMTGSGWAYAARAILWDMLTVITLGLALPWRAAALERYRMGHTHFGDLTGSFVGNGASFFRRGWWLWLLLMLPVIAIAVLAGAKAGFAPSDAETLTREAIGMAVGFSVLFWFPALLVAFPIYQAIAIRWRLEGLRFGALSLTCDLRKRHVLGAYAKAMLIATVVMGVGGILFQLVMDGFGFSFDSLNEGELPPPAFWVLLVGFYILAMVAMAVITLQFITRDVWRLAIDSVTVVNLAALDDAAARGAAVSGLGEGLADALDFGSGVGV